MIEAARGGLVVDLKSLPLAPNEKKQIEQTFDIVSKEDCEELSEQTADMDVDEVDVVGRLQRQLTSQLQLCLRHKEHCRALGHVADMNRFEHLATSVKQDLDVVVVAKSLGQDPPKFHYENKVFSVVQCNTDLNENDLELTIVRGIAYNVTNPKEIDTYVKFEFPYPQEAPVSDRTGTVKDTNSPQYDAVFTLPIQRNNRQCLRVFKRHAIKFEVYSRGHEWGADVKRWRVGALATSREAAGGCIRRRQVAGVVGLELASILYALALELQPPLKLKFANYLCVLMERV
ncbi:hypothetical protein RR48_06723 [Papilio machaon]|uniref:C2 domain-containing protein n=1 Tax=Papilio machaon TaxID=76193 RepID=A0A194R7L0_PAPMA|nr:hypothetical protein RR48_06723 [Papilio machaon]